MPVRTDAIAPNFDWGEVIATDKDGNTKERLWAKLLSSPALQANARGLASVLQKFRDRWGSTTVTSWYRDLPLNILVRGDARSGHLTASAADFRLTIRNSTKLELAWEWMGNNLRPFTSQMIAYRRDDGTIIRFHIALSFGGGRLAELKEKRSGVFTTIATATTFPVRDPSAPILSIQEPSSLPGRAAQALGGIQDAIGAAVGRVRGFLAAGSGDGLPVPALALFGVLLLLIAGRGLGGGD